MQEFPHHYVAAASAGSVGSVTVTSQGLGSLETAGPAEFGGPGDKWSPETLLVASVADCFILGFRAVARAARLDWMHLSCDVVGDLDRLNKITRFTTFRIRARLEVPSGTSPDKAMQMLEKAKKTCLITNSMTADTELDADVIVADRSA
jgi:organic hydroperoxide reductase OsmC/OhrA